MTDGPDEPTASSDGVSRRRLLQRGALTTAGGIGLLVSPATEGSQALLDGEPVGVHAAFGIPPQTSMNVGWTGKAVSDARVEYGRSDLSNSVAATATVLPGKDLVGYDATLTGLSPGTEYRYRAVMNGTASETFVFETAPGTEESSFRVTTVGDHGIKDDDNPYQRAEGDAPERIVDRAQAFDPDFHLCIGDIAYANGYPFTWDEYFDAFEPFYAATPFMTVPGNHEKEPATGFAQYDGRLNRLMPIENRDLVSLSSKQRWYDFQYGNTLFVGLNTSADACGDVARGEEFLPFQDTRCYIDEAELYNEEQRAYVEETLAAADDDPSVKWKVVYHHSSLWTDGDHAAREDLRDLWGPYFDEYGVDLVIAGHNHSYERSKPIRGDSVNETGTTYVVNGTGGSGHYGFQHDEPPEWTAFRDSDHYGIVRLEFSKNSIEGAYVSDDGTVVDEFTLVKTADGAPTQRNPGDATRRPLAVGGNREDDGSTFSGGETNRVRLTATADQPVRLRDVIPEEWTIEGYGDSDPSMTDADRAPEGKKYVYFDVEPSTEAEVLYYATAPDSPSGTGSYTFGPFEAREVNGTGWVPVDGTIEEETVV